jgi:hypothetical protein
MTSFPRLGSGLLVLALSGACTSHSNDDPEPRVDPEPEPEPEQPAATPTPAESVPRGPLTPLSLKPFTGALGDVTGDGQVDVVALCHHDPKLANLLVLRGASDGTFSESEPLLVQASGIALGDLDSDGDLDALLTDARGIPAYRVGKNDGAGGFTVSEEQHIPGRYGGELKGPSLIDFDGDGKLDAVVPLWDSIRAMPGDGAGAFDSGRAIEVGRDPFDVALGDLDGDGKLDLVATSGAAVAYDEDVYDSNGASAWIFRASERGFARPVRVEIAGARELELGDLDGDGKLEIVVSGASGLTVIRDPLGELEVERALVATDGPLLLADVLDPAGLELITSSYMQSRIHALTGPDWQKTSFEAGSFVVGLYSGDVAHDGGRMDVVVLNAGPPGGDLGAPAPSIEVLFTAG